MTSASNKSITQAAQGTKDSGAGLLDHIRNLPQYLLPQRLLTALFHRITRITTPWFKHALISGFIRQFGVDMSEAAEPNPKLYPDFNTFFTRPLRADARPLAGGDTVPICPVDGRVSQLGPIVGDTIFQAKGRDYSLTELLADSEQAKVFQNGCFATLYLAPRDYHRIHMPLRGTLRAMTHIPGRLFSVSPLTTRVIPRLFARNERVVTLFDTELGPMTLVLVGAINVASIETVWAGTITPPLGTTLRRWDYSSQTNESIVLDKGAELGRFNMGSTVIVLFAEGKVQWANTLQAETRVRMGQTLGTCSHA